MPATYDKIETQTLGTATASLTFSTIPGTYTDLVLVAAYQGNGNANILGRFNGDTGSNYNWTYLDGNGSTVTSGRAANQTILNFGYQFANQPSNAIISVQNYANTTTHKTAINRQNNPSNYLSTTVNSWRNTAAITSFTILTDSGTFTAGSSFTLYGIKAA